MSPKDKEPSPANEEQTKFVAAVIARSIEEAKQYSELLHDHDIPAIIADDEDKPAADANPRRAYGRSVSNGVPVLVPEALLDEASEVIADREDLEEFRVDQEEPEEEDDEEFGLTEKLHEDLDEPADDDDLLFDEDDEDEEDYEQDDDEDDEEEF